MSIRNISSSLIVPRPVIIPIQETVIENFQSVSSFTKGSQFKFVLKKIAATSSDAPSSNNPYVLQVGVHYECDTLGSRQIITK